jgi:hypothetical protein
MTRPQRRPIPPLTHIPDAELNRRIKGIQTTAKASAATAQAIAERMLEGAEECDGWGDDVLNMENE